MPKIQTKRLAEHRDWRRHQLIEAAASIALESGGSAITVALVAERAGLSRTSVYEYFSSSEDLVADLVLDELHNFIEVLTNAIGDQDDCAKAISQWIEAALRYISDGRHMLAKALSSISTPRERAAEIGAAHRALLAPLAHSLKRMGVVDISQAMALIQSATDVATKRIESGTNAEEEIASTTAFCLAGLKAIIESSR